MFPKIQFIVHN